MKKRSNVEIKLVGLQRSQKGLDEITKNVTFKKRQSVETRPGVKVVISPS